MTVLALLSNTAWLALAISCVWLLLRAAAHRTDTFTLAALAAVAVSGLALDGWTVADEVLVGAVLVGAALGRRPRSGPAAQETFGHRMLFLAFCVYLALQAGRGMIELIDTGDVLDAVRKARWPAFFMMLVWLAREARRRDVREGADWALAISKIGAVYMLAYVLTGVVAEVWLGIDRFSLQPGMAQYSGENLAGVALFGSSAYAMFPALVIVPAGLMLAGRSGGRRALMGSAAVASVLFAGIYYDSRVTLLLVLAMVLAAIPSALRFNARRIAAGLAACALLIAFSYITQPLRTSRTLTGLLSTGGAVWADDLAPERNRDIDRVTHIQAGLEAVSGTWPSFLFGYGYRMSSYIVGPYYYDIYTQSREFSSTANLENFATEGFTSLLVDAGWVGVAGLALCMVLAAVEIARRANAGDRILLLTALAAAAGWLVVINMLDIVMFYLMFMPGGLLVRLAASAAEARQERPAAARREARVTRLRPLVR